MGWKLWLESRIRGLRHSSRLWGLLVVVKACSLRKSGGHVRAGIEVRILGVEMRG